MLFRKSAAVFLLALAALFILNPIASANCDDRHFFFVQLTDTHFGDEGSEYFLSKSVESINKVRMNIEFVVVTGDIFSESIQRPETVRGLKSIMSGLKAPVHYLAGNHDVSNERDREIYEKEFGPLAYQSECEGVVLLFMHVETLSYRYKLDGYEPVKWLEERLRESKDRPVVLFLHSPPVMDYHDYTLKQSWHDKEALENFREIIRSHPNIRAVIGGHLHESTLGWIGETPVFVAESQLKTFNHGDSCYRIYEYDKGKVGFYTQYLR